MAIEDHPQFDAWVAALDELKRAKEVYQSAVAFNVRAAWIEHARLLVELAQENFDRLSDRIGDDA